MTFEMYAEGAPGLRVWWCDQCDGVAHHRAGESMPPHQCANLGDAIEHILAAVPCVAVPGETTYPVPARDLLRLRELWNRATGVTK